MLPFCDKCVWKQNCKREKTPCNAIEALNKICEKQVTEEKRALIREYAKALDVVEYEVSPELQALGEQVIDHMPELSIIRDFGVRVGYVLSYYPKIKNRRIICGDCRKVTEAYTAYLPFDFIVTFYQPNIAYMSANQQKILMLHELRHIGMGPKGLRLEPNDVEDFADILARYGITWNGWQTEVPDILAGDDDGKGKTNKKGGRNRQKMAT